MNTDITKKLQAILKATQWSQERLAHYLGVSSKTISFWITGKAQPHAKNLLEIDELHSDIIGRTSITPEILANTEANALQSHLELDELLENEELLKLTTLYLTYHTNNIEGSTMTIEDVATVLDNDNAILPDKTVREQLEARNHRTAFLYILSELKAQGQNFRWTADIIKNIHLRLMNGIIESAGNYRQHGVRIMGSPIPLSNYLSIPTKVDQLVNYLNSPYDNLIERMAITHATFEQIHPFSDGNGRTGRLIMFAQAIQAEIVPPLVIRERKKAYYKYLALSQLYENYDLLRLFIAESTLFTDNLLGSTEEQ